MTLCLKRIADSVCDTDVAAGQNLPLTLCPISPPQTLMHQIFWVLEKENESCSFHQSCFLQLRGLCQVDVEVFWEG